DLRGIVLHRGHGFLFLRIPPFICQNSMAIAVSAGPERGVTWRSSGICVIVIAVGEISAVIEQKPEPALAELIAVTLQVVAAELIDHDDDDQLGTSVVGRSKACRQQAEHKQAEDQGTPGDSHRDVVYRIGRPKTMASSTVLNHDVMLSRKGSISRALKLSRASHPDNLGARHLRSDRVRVSCRNCAYSDRDQPRRTPAIRARKLRASSRSNLVFWIRRR